MTVSASRDAMIVELKRVVVPALRELGFRGSFPHFRRPGERRVDILSFQFDSLGGRFVVEIGKFPARPSISWGGFVVPPEKVRVGHLRDRLRLGSTGAASDHWFGFESGDCVTAAAEVLPHLRGQAARWWDADWRDAPRGLGRRPGGPVAPRLGGWVHDELRRGV